MEVTSAEAYLEKSTKLVELPSGAVFRVRPLGVFDTVSRLKTVPRHMGMVDQPEKQETDTEETSNKEDLDEKMMEMIPELVEKNIVEPKVKWDQLRGDDQDMLAKVIVLDQFNAAEGLISFH